MNRSNPAEVLEICVFFVQDPSTVKKAQKFQLPLTKTTLYSSTHSLIFSSETKKKQNK